MDEDVYVRAERASLLALDYAEELDGPRFLLLRARVLGHGRIAVPEGPGYDHDDFVDAESWLRDVGALDRRGEATPFGWLVLAAALYVDSLEGA